MDNCYLRRRNGQVVKDWFAAGGWSIQSILRDGRQTGPQCTPSAINTSFGWVLFGKIQGSDVVHVANLTLEQDVLRELTG